MNKGFLTAQKTYTQNCFKKGYPKNGRSNWSLSWKQNCRENYEGYCLKPTHEDPSKSPTQIDETLTQLVGKMLKEKKISPEIQQKFIDEFRLL